MLSSSSFQYRTPFLHPHLPSPKPTLSPFTLQSNSNPHFRNPSFLKPPPLLDTKPLQTLLVQAKSPPADRPSEQKWVFEGLITESLPNGMFRVRLDNEDLILGYVSGKIRKNFVRILPGDRVKVEVSRYDSSKGRIVYRLRSSS
ncbi:translation initiation factor IF-1, chloroplastic [Senna tora]|uniref:Translation initiation factor IF-1, chloroplastic n=1 Tax=Senna tora TaxID=362788 RepID=A0A834X308_9FABA|nr:translation initiation factor IF-1, chloroplastic [Senna tora]